MKQTIRTGPKRRRWRRRDWSGKGGYGQVRRDGSESNRKLEREARRAGLTGKIAKHDQTPMLFGQYGEPVAGEQRRDPLQSRGVIIIGSLTAIQEVLMMRYLIWGENLTNPSPAPATPEREEAGSSSRIRERGEEEE